MKNEYVVTKKLLRSWVTENMYKGMQLGFNIGWAAFALACLAMLIFAAKGAFDYFIYGALFVICAYNAYFRIFPVAAAQYRRMSKTYGTDNWTRTIEFGDERITLSEGTISAEYEYSDIVKIGEKDNIIRLTARNRTVLRLYRDAFVGGTWEDCRELINQRRKS